MTIMAKHINSTIQVERKSHKTKVNIFTTPTQHKQRRILLLNIHSVK